MTKRLSKIKNKQYQIISTKEWYDIIPIGNIPVETDPKIIHTTSKTSALIIAVGQYIGLDLFRINTIQQLGEWQYIFKNDGQTGILININSIGDKYQVGLYSYI